MSALKDLWTDEHRMFRETARRFFEREVQPFHAKWEEDGVVPRELWRKAGDMAVQLKAEVTVLDDALRAYEADIHKLQSRLREARSRQSQIAARLESAENRFKLRSLMTNERVDEALSRFDQMERQVDYAEGRADALGMTGPKSLEEEIAELRATDKVDAELEAMKAALKAKGA